MTEDAVNIGNLDQKMKMLEGQFSQCVNNYHKPLTFMAEVDSMIQSLRNYTFAVQANKESIPDFDKWYKPWQTRMKNEPYMKWLNSTRVQVVHEDKLTTRSNAKLTLDTDHTQSIISEHRDIMTDTGKLIEDAKALAEENPEFRHSTGHIDRHYLFDVGGEDVEALDLLGACYTYMRILKIDLANYLNGKKIITGNLPPLKGKFSFSDEKLRILFKLKDGSVLNKKVVTRSREEILKDKEAAKKRYGNFKPKHGLDSKNKSDVVRGQFEVAKRLFEKDGYHITMAQIHNDRGWYMETPLFRDRAEKIAYFRELASRVKSENIKEIIFTTETWLYPDVKRGIKHIQSGKEIKSLRKKSEALQVYYINNEGRIILSSAPIIRKNDKASLLTVKEDKIKPESFALFYPIFAEWGLVDKVRLEHLRKEEEV